MNPQEIDELLLRQRSMTDQMRARVSMYKPYTVAVTQAIDRVADVRAVFHRKRLQIESDPSLSASGRRGKVADLAQATMADCARAGRPARRAAAHATSERVALMQVAKPAPGDLVGEMRRQEVRRFLREQESPSRRAALVSAMVGDELGRAAVLDAPPEMSGLDPAFHARFRDDVAEKVNGPRLAELAQMKADNDQIGIAANILRNELFVSAGMTDFAFNEAMGKLEADIDKD